MFGGAKTAVRWMTYRVITSGLEANLGGRDVMHNLIAYAAIVMEYATDGEDKPLGKTGHFMRSIG
jgi:hypothetical protein